MKKLLTIIFLLLSVFSIGQTVPFPNKHSVSSPTTIETFEGAVKYRWGDITTGYNDTTSANINTSFKTYPGATMRVGNKLYIRSSDAQFWVEIGSGKDTFAVEYPIIVKQDAIVDGVKRDTLGFSDTYVDSLITAAGGGSGTAAGNYNNVQINRYGFATPLLDSLTFATGLLVKGLGTYTGKLTVNSGGKTLVLGGISGSLATYSGLCFGCTTPDFTNYFAAGDENTTYIRGGTNFQFTVGSTNRAVMNSVGFSLDPNNFGTAALYLPIGTTAASTAPLKFKLTSSALMTTPEAGAVEAVTGRIYYTDATPTRNTLAYLSDLTALTRTWQQVMDAGATTTTSGVLNNAKFTFNPTSVQELLRITPITSFSGAANWSTYMDQSDNGDGTFNYPVYIGFRDAGKRGIWSSFEPWYVSGGIKLEAHPVVVRNGNDLVDMRLMSFEYSEAATAATSSVLAYLRTSVFEVRSPAVDNGYFIVEPVNGIKLYNTATSTTDYWQLSKAGGAYGSTYAEIGFLTTGTAHQHSAYYQDTRTAVAPHRWFGSASGVAAFNMMELWQDGSLQLGSVGTQIASTRLYAKGLGATSGTYAFKLQNSASTDLFGVRNDGAIAVAGSVGTSGYVLTSGGAGAAASWAAASGSSKWTDVGVGNIYRNDSVRIGSTSNPTEMLDVTGNIKASGSITSGSTVLGVGGQFSGSITAVDGTFSGNVTGLNLLSGTYTPTITNISNIDNTTAYVTGYDINNTSVKVYGEIDIDPTLTATDTQLSITLPSVFQNFANTGEAGGTGTCNRLAGSVFGVNAIVGSTEVLIRFVSTDINNRIFQFSFSYQKIP